MKIEKTLPNEDDFTPIEIVITIESQKELTTFSQLASMGISIPEVCRNQYGEYCDPNLIRDILFGLRKNL